MAEIHKLFPEDNDEMLIEKSADERPRVYLDLRQWSYQQFNDFLRAYMKQQWEVVMPLVMRIVVSWTYDEPLTPDAWKRLPMPELPEIAYAVMNALTSFSENLDTSTVKVDMTRWTIEDYTEYRAAAKRGDVEKVERLMRKVCRLPEKPDKRLSYEEGALMAKAIHETTNKMFARGN